MRTEYTALIRTFNSETLLKETLESLRSQTHPPKSYVFVDSGSTDGTRNMLPEGGYFHAYRGDSFNYSEAINQGLDFVAEDHVLIISSHTTLANPLALDYASRLLEQSEDCAAAYFDNGPLAELGEELITKRNFNGFNGLCNTCALIKMEWLAKRTFRRELFAAEDQEWAAWLLRDKGKATLRVLGAGMSNTRNPYMLGYVGKKYINEQVAVAYFVERRLLSPWHVARVLSRAVNPLRSRSGAERLTSLRLAASLVTCWFRKPDGASRYFR
ncbi:Glycosyltransferase family 2 protein [Hyphomicrobiales bacterium]|nr:Glycosyltransferase family 2 protein [Hyphomicrobiales bacterium]CAH1699157.1 Glycosyltransferase family 2 protein [Hyphomicrobiales bacterium]CAI0342943.1 Glycosyltransferase family 2 protein [Hyphomicrobiales bacterium]